MCGCFSRILLEGVFELLSGVLCRDSSQHEEDHCNLNESLPGFSKFFIVFAKSTTATQPSEGPFHDPTAWQNVKSLGVVAAFDDLQYPAARLLHPIDQLSTVAAIRPNELQSRKLPLCFFQDLLGTVTVLNVGRVNDHTQQQTDCIDQNMPFPPLYLFARIITASPPFSVVFTDWLSMIAALGVGSRPACRRVCSRRVS